MASVVAGGKQKSLQDAELKEKLQELRKTDNWTNWYYLVRTYLYLALVIGGAVWFDLYRQSAGWSVLWDVPVFLLAIVLVGAGQHQLTGLAHEGAHHILFRNRVLNELASDWFCMYPLFSSTHVYRLQHLAHHQFINDPVRDPDVAQLKMSGHWLRFPLLRSEFVRTLLKQAWLPNLFRFIIARAKFNATGVAVGPYVRKDKAPSKAPVRIALAYFLPLIALLVYLVNLGDALLLALLPAALHLVPMTAIFFLPADRFLQARVHSSVASRWLVMLRITHIALVFNALAWIQFLTGQHAWLYYLLLWLIPAGTSFSFFMILRQLVQHGNGDRGWLTNTRVFYVHRFISFAVFPMGQDYHLPHHLFATVPHYRLRRLHEALLAYPEYREQAVEVHGYFRSPERPQVHPTVLDIVGPEWAAKEFRGVHIDNTVLEDCEVEEKAEIVREGEEEARRVTEAAHK
jgi:fatty acid desaturase